MTYGVQRLMSTRNMRSAFAAGSMPDAMAAWKRGRRASASASRFFAAVCPSASDRPSYEATSAATVRSTFAGSKR